MRKNTFIALVKETCFRELFITEMGWNNYRGQAELPLIEIDEQGYQFYTIAERSGFQILTCEVDEIPASSVCKRIDTKLRRSANDYIAIYILKGTEHHLWVAPVRNVEKRDLVTIEYETAEKADFLFSKIEDLSFSLSESTTIVDVKERVQGTFAVNSEKITKDFYSGFKKEHNAFAAFITGIDDNLDLKTNRNKQWYASVMLNRMMFCYFIQKKGFLNGDFDYLRNKLEWCQREKGENRFFKSFYQGFLTILFQDGLNAPAHNNDFVRVYGKIPYLNGGMFDKHQLELDYRDIDIEDDAFVHLFDFFDKWRWHLDTRISATGKDINPDVLGYIFEQYINDRAQMGAYYTKEDITEYIGRNCILPFLFDKVATVSSLSSEFTSSGSVWKMLKQSGLNYVFDAVKVGYTERWKEEIPQNIAIGLDTTTSGLLERRVNWNQPTPEPWTLPTEIWRETIDRLKRCEEIRNKIENGEIHSINDFITYNLNIRQFVQDLLATTDNHLLIRHFYKALQSVTILDPTCGSGAFLFAALNILEPLYEECINRMQEFNSANPHLFVEELGEIAHKYRSNIQYFIYKSIILRNLYGVDIMAEATEIAKLRLFLKMVAVVEVDHRAPNLGLDPLPDIDFNIRCGNTLVGYATEKEVEAGISYTDVFAAQEFRDKVEIEMEKVSMAYDHFRTQQLDDHNDMVAFKEAKHELRLRLGKLTNLLDQQQFKASGQQDFNAWKASHLPFHWIAEFYQIIHGNGGFDVVIGNPPYVQLGDINYTLHGYTTIKCGDIYALCVERVSSSLLNIIDGRFGMIVPISISSTDGYKSLRTTLHNSLKGIYLSNFGVRPAKLFDGVDKRLTIFLSSNNSQIYCTKYYRWSALERTSLFANITYSEVQQDYLNISGYSKIGSSIEKGILHKLSNKKSLNYYYIKNSDYQLLYTRKLQYFIQFFVEYPVIYNEKNEILAPSELKYLYFDKKELRDLAISFLNSNLFFWFFIVFSDCRNVNSREINNFPSGLDGFKDCKTLIKLSDKVLKNLKDNSQFLMRNDKRAGKLRIQSFQPRYSKPIIDEIDKVLAKHYGFTEEELDFIINYDIKYRMGDELNSNNEEE